MPEEQLLEGRRLAGEAADAESQEMTQGILEAVVSVLRPGGTFTTFQYVLGYPTPLASALRREMTARLGVGLTRRLVMRNVPPAFVLTWQRPSN